MNGDVVIYDANPNRLVGRFGGRQKAPKQGSEEKRRKTEDKKPVDERRKAPFDF
ncbi:MAG: hypothetical protein NT166_17275 [Candidatus Aminicenantes bacterium]|nr:hypothetical protein [Candidatus Aminicenantes bacterium]